MAEGAAERIEFEKDGAAILKEELLKLAGDGKVSCAQAIALAERLGMEPQLVGRAANELKIKITACRLGCF
ncbi:MAG: hypothetical protein PWQ41_237 [Bacillota bacterium]|jgi:hypothetical protein|nr:hypothetical protein [Bacillota bacterium]MDK2855403.1 hypothetical protein [Bacillota bacterium]MDK2924463.1 hypothetical protein [Bacillota bacterium]